MFKKVVQDKEWLRKTAGEPGELARKKVISHIDGHCAAFIEKSPFAVLSTSNSEGQCDSSPRGDAPGFVKVLDEQWLVIPERRGNRRMDSIHNILENPAVGVLFIIPGLNETLRINGSAQIIMDEDILAGLGAGGTVPAFAIAVKVSEAYIHCGKAFIRSGLWNTESWLPAEQRPAAAKILSAHAAMPETDEADIEASLKEAYKSRLY